MYSLWQLVLAYLAGLATLPLAVLIFFAICSYAAAAAEAEAGKWELR